MDEIQFRVETAISMCSKMAEMIGPKGPKGQKAQASTKREGRVLSATYGSSVLYELGPLNGVATRLPGRQYSTNTSHIGMEKPVDKALNHNISTIPRFKTAVY